MLRWLLLGGEWGLVTIPRAPTVGKGVGGARSDEGRKGKGGGDGVRGEGGKGSRPSLYNFSCISGYSFSSHSRHFFAVPPNSQY